MTQPPMQPTPIALRERRDQTTDDIVNAMTGIMARPGWVTFVLTAPLDDEDKLLALRLIVGLHKTTIERAGHAMAAQWLRDKHDTHEASPGASPPSVVTDEGDAAGAAEAAARAGGKPERDGGFMSAPTPRGKRRDRSTDNALIEGLSSPGWLDELINMPASDDIWQERAVGWLCRVIIRLFRDVIERESRALAARWRHDRDPRGRARLIKGRRVRSPLRARRPTHPPLTPPHAE